MSLLQSWEFVYMAFFGALGMDDSSRELSHLHLLTLSHLHLLTYEQPSFFAR